jgi:hypothetical protein
MTHEIWAGPLHDFALYIMCCVTYDNKFIIIQLMELEIQEYERKLQRI